MGADFLVFKNTNNVCIDPRYPIDGMMEELSIDENRQFILHPGEFALGMTYETVAVPNDMVLQLNGKSSLGRIGLIVHATAGYVDPANTLKITLELHNLANLPIKLYYKMPIAQVAFVTLTSEVDVPYGKDALNSKYFGQRKAGGQPVPQELYPQLSGCILTRNRNFMNLGDYQEQCKRTVREFPSKIRRL